MTNFVRSKVRNLLILLLLVCILLAFCKKPNVLDSSKNLQMNFVDEEISYTTGDTLRIDIEFENYGNKDIMFPLDSPIFTLNYKQDIYLVDNFAFHNISNIDKDSIGVFSLPKNEKKRISLSFIPIPWKEKMTEGKYSFQLVINVELIDELGNSTKYITASKNIIRIDVKHTKFL
ncbi:MAG: hypothetical protein GY865_19340 [candidate division Zixibacteria bacterium]|nr:hypothetical protein [candidate division Zixibacteria bacterium]